MSEDTESKEDKTESSTKGLSIPRTIFSSEEIRNIVKSFVFAWITGKITINFESRYEIIKTEKEHGRTMNPDDALKRELAIKSEITDLVEICSGITQSTETELENSVLQLFSKILDYKGALRIEGSFMDYTMQDRLDELEKKVDANSNVVEQLIRWLTDEAKGNEKNKY